MLHCVVVLGFFAALASMASGLTPSEVQLPEYAATSPFTELTTTAGCPVQARQADVGLNIDLIRNEYFIEFLTHVMGERIPERVVHAKGAGAFGYFEVTNDVTDLTKAKFLNKVGKKTRVAARFSPNAPNKGGSELNLAVRGFGIKFYTEEGNWDLAGMNTPIFYIRDPIKTVNFPRVVQRNPQTNLIDFNMIWDFVVQNPEGFFAFLMSSSPYGTPDGYAHMRGFGLHSMQLANSKNETNFARFYFEPVLGVKNLTISAVNDPDYLTKNMFDSIANGSYPEWTVYIQPITEEQVLKEKARGIDLFDVTREIDREDYPYREIGKLVLNENPKNYFTDVEQLAFCPGSVVPGIVGAPDSLFAARSYSYRAAAIHRLGVNFNKIPVNRPINKAYTYARDGVEPNLDNEGGAPTYYPNSFNGPKPRPDHQPPLYKWQDLPESSNYDQASRMFDSYSENDKQATVTELARTLRTVDEGLKKAAFDLMLKINKDLHDRVASKVE